ncbi:MAG: hypothetical protein ABR951_08865 [Candidatus Aminicenantales bacterium]|jgi:hypothetical protein
MKKTIIATVIWGLVLGGAVPLLQAKENPVSIFLNLGGVWNVWITPQYLTLGLQVDVRFGKLLMLSPELNVWFENFHSGGYHLVPGAVLNLRLGRFFLGGGLAAERIGGGWSGGSSGIHPKFNIGYRTRHFKLIAAAVPESGFFYGVMTAGLGF